MPAAPRRWSLWEKQLVVFCVAMALVLPWQLLFFDFAPADYADKGIWYVQVWKWTAWAAEVRAFHVYFIVAQVLMILAAVIVWHRTAIALAVVLPLTWPWFVDVGWV